MKTLFLDLASATGTMACVDSDVRSIVNIDRHVRDGALFDLLSSCLKKANWSTEDIERIACITGPGGFMSLRIGITLANTLADQLTIPIAGIRMDRLYRSKLSVLSSQLFWLHSTQRSRLFLSDLSGESEPQLISIDDLASHLSASSGYCGELIPEHEELVKKTGATSIALESIKTSISALLEEQTYKSAQLEPWYGREG